MKGGGTIRIHKGIYHIDRINFKNYPNAFGSKIEPTTIEGVVGELVIFDGKKFSVGKTPMLDFKSSSGITLKNIEIKRSKHFGIYISDAKNISLKNLTLHNNGGTGVYISGGHGSVDNILIKNCDSYHNFNPDTFGENEDGFACAWGITGKVKFEGCRAWENADDGYDFWMASYDINNNKILTNNIIIKNCWAFRNGINIWNSKTFTGDGNGFKFGKHGGRIHASYLISIMNNRSGFIDNGNDIGMVLESSIAYKNNAYGIVMATPSLSGTSHIINNCTSLRNSKKNFVGIPSLNEMDNSWNTTVEIKEKSIIDFEKFIRHYKRDMAGTLPICLFGSNFNCIIPL